MEIKRVGREQRRWRVEEGGRWCCQSTGARERENWQDGKTSREQTDRRREERKTGREKSEKTGTVRANK